MQGQIKITKQKIFLKYEVLCHSGGNFTARAKELGIYANKYTYLC